MNFEALRDKSELKKIMSGAIRVNSKSMEVSKLTLHCCEPPPSFRTTFLFYIYLLTSMWVTIVGAIWSLQYERVRELVYWYGPLAILAGFLGIIAAFSYRRRNASLLKARMEVPCAELSGLAGYLEKYTNDMRRRTQSLFHSVGDDSLKNLIYIDNIRCAVAEKNQLLKSFMSDSSYSYRDVLEADAYLRAPLNVFERPELKRGECYIIEMENLRDIVEVLIANMDLGVNKIEDSRKIDFSKTHDIII